MMQPLFSASVLVDLMRPDGTSNISVMGGEVMSAELAHEIMGLQVCLVLSSRYYFANALASIIANWLECNHLEAMYLLVTILTWFGLGFFKFLSFFWY